MSPVAPVVGPITAGYPTYPNGGAHHGVDFGVPDGTPVRANRAGTIARADYDTGIPSFGWHVRETSGSLTLIYGHMSQLVVKPGQQVAEGQLIGYSGHSGNATGPHLHFEVRDKGAVVNPMPYLTGGSSSSSSGSGVNVVPAVGHATQASAAGILGGLDAVGAFFGALGQRNTWIRVLQVVGGSALIVGGVVIVGRGVIGDVAISAIPGGPALKAAAGAVK